jgi:DNA-binding response OmpR family regulator
MKERTILLDLGLPKLDGLEVLRRLRSDERTKCLRVLILTWSDEERGSADSHSLNASSLIREPAGFAGFGEAARQVGLGWLVLNRSVSHGRRR